MATRTRITARPSQLRLSAFSADWIWTSTPLAGGALLTVAVAAYVATHGLTLPILALVGLAMFAAVVSAFMLVPWIAVPVTIVVYTVLSTVRAFTSPTVGGVKDVISLAGMAAAAAILVQRRASRRELGLDRPLIALLGLLLALYIGNIGGAFTGESGHGSAWIQGIRLLFEPLSLFVVGCTLREPRRTFRTSAATLVACAVGATLVSFVQQYLGVGRLLQLGYTYGDEVRQIAGGKLRSFGTFEEPFSYAAFLLLALSLLLVRKQWNLRVLALFPLLAIGLYLSYVRTAVVILLALIGLALARRGQAKAAGLLLAIAAVGGTVVLIAATQQSATRTVPVSATTYLTLNGRTKLWRSQLGRPSDLIVGRGVGATGTAAERAQRSLLGKQKLNTAKASTVVDSAYFALLADVGIVGVVIMFGFLGRIGYLARRAASAGEESGWAALGLLTVFMLDGLSRESFTGFPTAYVAMLLLGTCCATWRHPRAAT